MVRAFRFAQITECCRSATWRKGERVFRFAWRTRRTSALRELYKYNPPFFGGRFSDIWQHICQAYEAHEYWLSLQIHGLLDQRERGGERERGREKERGIAHGHVLTLNKNVIIIRLFVSNIFYKRTDSAPPSVFPARLFALLVFFPPPWLWLLLRRWLEGKALTRWCAFTQ